MSNKPNYCIMRIEKLKSVAGLSQALRHVFREQNTPNADPKKTVLNENLTVKLATGTNSCIQRFKERIRRLAKQPRSNAVLAVEAIFTASPEAMAELSIDERREYFLACVRWMGKKVGAENMLTACIHRDETTEHCHFVFIPIALHDNTLNCRKLFGGHKSRASELQDEFYEAVGKPHGLSRGKKGTRVAHTSLREHNALVHSELPKLRAEKHELKLQCEDLTQRIERGHSTLEKLLNDLEKIVKERADAIVYSFNELKRRLKERWGMIYQGHDNFQIEAESYIQEEIEHPKPTFSRRLKR